MTTRQMDQTVNALYEKRKSCAILLFFFPKRRQRGLLKWVMMWVKIWKTTEVILSLHIVHLVTVQHYDDTQKSD